VRILLGEQLPRRLARELVGHFVLTVQQLGWTGVRNGELLRRAAAYQFDVFETGDQNVEFQQNLSQSPLCVVILAARSNQLKALIPLVPALQQAVLNPRPGEVRRVATP
jgi:hypothetical protein